MQQFSAGGLTFVVSHELWDGNMQDHADQGVSILVSANSDGKQTVLLRFNCFDIEKSYVYGPENPKLKSQVFRMDPVTDGNPIGWTIRTLSSKLFKMLERAGYADIATTIDYAAVAAVLPEVEASARALNAAKRNTVKHNRGTHIFEAGNIRFGLEMRRQRGGDGGLAVHVLADVGGSTQSAYVEETEILAFDCFWDAAHYHYGPRNKNHRIYWDKTLVDDPFGWLLEQLEHRRLGAMIERAGYPGIAADLDMHKIAAVLPAISKKGREMQAEGMALTGHPGLPLEPTPNLARQ
jgi:hypothetical protein